MDMMVNNTFKPIELYQHELRPKSQQHVISLRCEPLERVRIAFVGLGMRMMHTLERFAHVDKAEISVLCDISQIKLEKALSQLRGYGCPAPDIYCGAEDWKRVCERPDIDLVYISTHYDLHVPIAVHAMECGKHVAVEVPAATTLEGCWQLVDTAERTRRHCIQLENCNYGPFEMAALQMVKKGVLGELVHVEGAYIHDLKELLFDENGYWDMWRLKNHEQKNGNLYPTHGLGPLCHALDIHRNDRMEYLVSMSSNQFNLKSYAADKFGSNSDYAQRHYANGDMSSTLIKTTKGKTILLQHDITSPRPYSRSHLMSGTRGVIRQWPQPAMALTPNAKCYMPENEMRQMLLEFEHPIRHELQPIIDRLAASAPSVAKNVGMDYVMDYRLVHCLTHGLPLDMDVYDAAEWSCIVELTGWSANNYSVPVAIPDFTRGAYANALPLMYW